MKALNRPATGLRIFAATILEAAPIAHQDSADRRDRLLKCITGLADMVRTSPAPLVGNLVHIIELVEESLNEESDGPLSQCLDEFLGVLQGRHGTEQCALCVQRKLGEPLCAALGAWPSAHPSHLCIDQVASLLFDLEQRSRAIYVSHAKELATTAVKFTLVPVASGAEHGFIPEFHLDGATRATEGTSWVEIVLEDRALDLRTLRQLAYVCVHELICHAFQGILGQERRNVGASCSWSEGWMDAVAWLLLERWLNEARALPAWLIRAPTPRSAIDDCRKVHDRRYAGRQGRVMDPENILRRQQARDACEALYRHWSGPDFKYPNNGLRKLVQFSVSLNVAALERKQREELIVQLVSGLLLSKGHVLDRTILACEMFLNDKTKDPLRLMDNLPGGRGLVYPRSLH